MITLQVIESWQKESYPEGYEYRICITRNGIHLRTSRLFNSKAELVACVDGLEIAFELNKEEFKVEFSDIEGDSGNYYEYFYLDRNDSEHYLDCHSGGSDREDFHSDG